MGVKITVKVLIIKVVRIIKRRIITGVKTGVMVAVKVTDQELKTLVIVTTRQRGPVMSNVSVKVAIKVELKVKPQPR